MNDIKRFITQVEDVLHNNILSFWIDRMVDPKGGFYGRISGNGNIDENAPKGAVLTARILWTFSAAYRIYGKKEYFEMAKRAKSYLLDKFYDREFGGIFWSLNADGTPLDTKKQFYALGFAIYGLSEYYRATEDDEALEYAIKLYDAIEEHSFCAPINGYIEATRRDWRAIDDMRLSEKDANEKISMNTHLHIIEPYTNLFRVWKDHKLKQCILNLITIFTDKIYNPDTGHLSLFFDEQWRSRDEVHSYGHDVESSWLLLEAATIVDEKDVINDVMSITEKIAVASINGIQSDGSMIYERHADGSLDTDRHWWVQAEAVVGFVWLYTYHGDDDALQRALKCWNYIVKNLIDHRGKEWYWSCLSDGTTNLKDDKAGFWKCPYHNSRMCFEVLSKLKSIVADSNCLHDLEKTV